MMVNNNLVGGAITILKNDGVRREGWHPNAFHFNEMENQSHVPNHQPWLVTSSEFSPFFLQRKSQPSRRLRASWAAPPGPLSAPVAGRWWAAGGRGVAARRPGTAAWKILGYHGKRSSNGNPSIVIL
jgi:hypothetical protein